MDIAVIGGGFAGLCAAVKCAEIKTNNVTVYERQEKAGKKILMTGNGRCNLTNADGDDLSKYVTGDREKLTGIYKNASFMNVIDFFEKYGLFIRAKEGGIYPFSNKASSVRDVLLNAAKNNNVRIITDTYIENVSKETGKYIINGSEYDRVILACGGKAGVYKEQEFNGFKITKNLDLDYEYFSPGLCGVKCDGDFALLNKSRAEAKVTLISDSAEPVSDEGEIQFTDYGLSGIPVFNLSLYI
ncbi:MAG: NAD(P)/FAD-dependent oxidoreductase, partial [Lachnospiraceae bacterium]|nr:NAD(P)/FAD-dependent oxidoreductase [Lachnospiraceae bacterium]